MYMEKSWQKLSVTILQHRENKYWQDAYSLQHQ